MRKTCKKKLMIFSRTNIYGGHEMMSCKAISYLQHAGKYQLSAVISADNKRLADVLAEIGIKTIRLAGHTGRFQAVSNYTNFILSGTIENLLKKIRPDLIIALQGNIEYSSEIFMPAKKLGIKLISYIPMAGRFSELSDHKISGFYRDVIDRRLFSLPDKWITINDEQKNLICSRGRCKESDVIVVRNGIDFERLDSGEKEAAILRQKLMIRDGQTVFGIIGRMIMKHKGQDLIVRMLAQYKEKFEDCIFVFAGDGQDRGALEKQISVLGVKDQVRMTGRISNVAEFYKLCDVIVIPSWFEGDPLVLYEALYSGCIVCGSSLPCIREAVLEKYIFDNKDARSMKDALLAAKKDIGTAVCDKDELKRSRSLETFQKEFCKAVDIVCSSGF